MVEAANGSRTLLRAEDAEALLNRLPGVVASRLVLTDRGEVEEVHVLTTPDRSQRQVVRDVERCLAGRWGLHVDPSRVSVARLAEARPVPPLGRVELLRLGISRDRPRGQLQVRVGLGMPGDLEPRFEGSAAGSAVPGAELQLAARAALAALDDALDHGQGLELLEAGVASLGRYQVAVVLLVGRGERRPWSGSAPVEHDPLESVVEACLSAARRWAGLSRSQRAG